MKVITRKFLKLYPIIEGKFYIHNLVKIIKDGDENYIETTNELYLQDINRYKNQYKKYLEDNGYNIEMVKHKTIHNLTTFKFYFKAEKETDTKSGEAIIKLANDSKTRP